MSHNALHNVITATYNFYNDELATVYIAFLKGIAIRLNEETINLFYNEVIIILNIRGLVTSLYMKELLSSMITLIVSYVLMLPSLP